jgi:hypothetical protein
MNENRCEHCHTIFLPNPRVKNQRYCNRAECRRARKTHWQKQKMATDPDYQNNQKEAWKIWSQQHLDYWKAYRSQHPEYVQHNRLKQGLRDKKRRLGLLAKMDAFTSFSFVRPGTYFLVPDLAKMDAFAQKIFLIPATSTDWANLAKKDLIDRAPGFSYNSPQTGGPL